MSGRPGWGSQLAAPLAASAERACASANSGLAGPLSDMPFMNRLTVSTPAATNTSPSPALMACAAIRMAWSEDEQ